MTIMGKSNSLGGSICAYTPNTILFDGKNGDTKEVNLKKGYYYIRAQGAGGGGGNCGVYGVGGGGGSGAGFEGIIKISDNLNNINCYAGIAPQSNRKSGEASYIGDIIKLGGGIVGYTDNGGAGVGGSLTISEQLQITSCQIKSNGYSGNSVVNGTTLRSGANSVLTNNGGGIAKGTFEERCATAPGAGGAGGKQWDLDGGYGMYGEVKIQYLKPKP